MYVPYNLRSRAQELLDHTVTGNIVTRSEPNSPVFDESPLRAARSEDSVASPRLRSGPSTPPWLRIGHPDLRPFPWGPHEYNLFETPRDRHSSQSLDSSNDRSADAPNLEITFENNENLEDIQPPADFYVLP